eukprot:gene7401-11725_t
MNKDTDDKSYKIQTTFQIKKHEKETFFWGFQQIKELTINEYGCLEFDLTRLENKEHWFCLSETYKSTLYFNFHQETEHSKKFEKIKVECLVIDSVHVEPPIQFIIDREEYKIYKEEYVKSLKNFIDYNYQALYANLSWMLLFEKEDANLLYNIFDAYPIMWVSEKIFRQKKTKIEKYSIREKLDIFFEAKFFGRKGTKRELNEVDSSCRKKSHTLFAESFIKINRHTLNTCVDSWFNGKQREVPFGCHLFSQAQIKKKECHSDTRYILCVTNTPTQLGKTVVPWYGNPNKFSEKEGVDCSQCNSKLIYLCNCGKWAPQYDFKKHHCPLKFELEINMIHVNGKFDEIEIKLLKKKDESLPDCEGYDFYASWIQGQCHYFSFDENGRATINSVFFSSLVNSDFEITLYSRDTMTNDYAFPFFKSQTFKKPTDTLDKKSISIWEFGEDLIDVLMRHLQCQIYSCSHRFVLILYCCLMNFSLRQTSELLDISKQDFIQFTDVEGKNGIFWYIMMNTKKISDIKEEFNNYSIQQQIGFYEKYKEVDIGLLKMKLSEIIEIYRFGFGRSIYDAMKSEIVNEFVED